MDTAKRVGTQDKLAQVLRCLSVVLHPTVGSEARELTGQGVNGMDSDIQVTGLASQLCLLSLALLTHTDHEKMWVNLCLHGP